MNPIQPLVDRWYRTHNERGPYFYPASPYGLGDLVPGNMPTRFGPLMPIPDGRAILASHEAATAPAEYFAQSIEQGAGQQPWIAYATREPMPANLDTRPGAAVPIGGLTLGRPLPSVFYPRPDASTLNIERPGIACWVNDHPLLSIGLAGLLYFGLRGKR